jgi:uncharacterized protein YutE (UPF0331/DUF86 family)
MSHTLGAKCLQVEGYLQETRALLDRISEDPKDAALQRALERLVQVTIEAAADAGDIWLADQGQTLGQSAAGVFRALARVGMLSGPIAARFVRYAGHRNQIVHAYDSVTASEVLTTAEGLLRDIPVLISALLSQSIGTGR